MLHKPPIFDNSLVLCIRVIKELLIFVKFPYLIGKHLAEHCRAEYPKVTNFVLWILAELAVVACDIPEGIEIHFSSY
jgi:hypothetical protein